MTLRDALQDVASRMEFLLQALEEREPLLAQTIGLDLRDDVLTVLALNDEAEEAA